MLLVIRSFFAGTKVRKRWQTVTIFHAGKGMPISEGFTDYKGTGGPEF